MIEFAAAQAPEIDYQGLSPLFATIGGTVAVLMAGLISGRFAQRVLVPFVAAASLLTAMGLTIANWEAGDSAPIIEGALAIDTLALFMAMLFYVAGLATVLLSLRADVTREAGRGEYMALLLGSITGMVIVAGAENLVTLFVGFELLSIPLYILCAAEVRKAPSLEAGLKYLVVGSVGSATLLYGLALLYGATGLHRLLGDGGRDRRHRGPRRPAAPHRRRARHRRPRLQGIRGAVPPVDARRLPGRPHPDHELHGGGHQGRGVRHRAALLRPGAAEPAERVGARRWPCSPRSRSSWATPARSPRAR